MRIRWRLKARAIRKAPAIIFSDPLGFFKFLFFIPFLWLHHKIEHWGEEDDSNDPLYIAMAERRGQEEIDLVLEFKKLLDELPPEFTDFTRYFGSSREYSEKEVDEIFSYPDAQKFLNPGLPYTRLIMRYGLQVDEFYYAVDGIGMLLKRLRRHEAITAEPIVIDRNTLHAQAISAESKRAEDITEMLIREIGMMTKVPYTELQWGFWRWIVAVLPHRPYLIEGYEARVQGNTLTLAPLTAVEPHSIYDTPETTDEKWRKRWRTTTVLLPQI